MSCLPGDADGELRRRGLKKGSLGRREDMGLKRKRLGRKKGIGLMVMEGPVADPGLAPKVGG